METLRSGHSLCSHGSDRQEQVLVLGADRFLRKEGPRRGDLSAGQRSNWLGENKLFQAVEYWGWRGQG